MDGHGGAIALNGGSAVIRRATIRENDARDPIFEYATDENGRPITLELAPGWVAVRKTVASE